MKAWILEKQAKVEEKPLKLQELPDPEPKEKEIRIKIHFSGICRTDIHIAEGDLPLKNPPLILGHQIVGIVDKVGKKVKHFEEGNRAGIAWLNSSCGECKFCLNKRENLCLNAKFTGWDVDGGFAEYSVISEDFAYHLGENLPFEESPPLMCAGIAGFRALGLTEAKRGDNLGLYGFGPTAAYIVQVAKQLGIETFAITRSEKNKNWARRMKANWVGGYEDELPVKLDAAILFPPVGHLVEGVLSQLARGGKLVLGAVTMTPIEIKDYNNIWMERTLTTLANITRKDGREFLKLAQKIKIKSETELFDFEQIPETLISAKQGKIKGSPVVRVV